jgi:hypothetical protein
MVVAKKNRERKKEKQGGREGSREQGHGLGTN